MYTYIYVYNYYVYIHTFFQCQIRVSGRGEESERRCSTGSNAAFDLGVDSGKCAKQTFLQWQLIWFWKKACIDT